MHGLSKSSTLRVIHECLCWIIVSNGRVAARTSLMCANQSSGTEDSLYHNVACIAHPNGIVMTRAEKNVIEDSVRLVDGIFKHNISSHDITVGLIKLSTQLLRSPSSTSRISSLELRLCPDLSLVVLPDFVSAVPSPIPTISLARGAQLWLHLIRTP